MHHAVVMACDDGVLPDQDRIDTVADEAALDEVCDTERQLFYVACTRAREKPIVSGVNPASEFFADLGQGQPIYPERMPVKGGRLLERLDLSWPRPDGAARRAWPSWKSYPKTLLAGFSVIRYGQAG